MEKPTFPLGDRVEFAWRASVSGRDVDDLHAEAFDGGSYGWEQCRPQSLGWVTAHEDSRLIGFVNMAWDGSRHAFLLDLAVAADRRRHGLGRNLVARALEESRRAGCEWVHVDYEPHLGAFYAACGFTGTAAGLHRVSEDGSAGPQ
jgi:GNAT superfamily N-acetyltransferase